MQEPATIEFILGVFAVLGGVIAFCLLPFIIERVNKLIFKLFIKLSWFQPCKNPLVNDTKLDRYNEWICRTYGCVTTASYYIGMPQATCKRCGGKNYCAQPQIPKWRLPDRYDKEQ